MTANDRDHGRKFGALLLIGIGVLFLFGGFNIGALMNFAWPFFIIVPGAILLFASLTGGRQTAGLAIPGMVVAGTGLIFFFQSLFDYYQSWAYVWALYPGFVGAGLLFMGLQRGEERQAEIGRNMMRGSLAAFVLFGGFFELLVFHRISGLGHVLLPLLLIGGGIFLLSGGPRRHMAMRAYGPWGTWDKPKNDQRVGGYDDVKAKNGDYRPKWDLNRRIEEALREDDVRDPEGFV
jgi:hypothetical protein